MESVRAVLPLAGGWEPLPRFEIKREKTPSTQRPTISSQVPHRPRAFGELSHLGLKHLGLKHLGERGQERPSKQGNKSLGVTPNFLRYLDIT